MDRKGFIGGTDAKRIMDGDWQRLYLEKTGQTEPEDLSNVFPVQLGKATEAFHLDWVNVHHDLHLRPIPNRMHHRKHTMLAAHIDAWSEARSTFVDTKHSNGSATRESMAETYLPQFAHYCNVFDVDHGWLSFIAGNAEPVLVKVAPPLAYREELIEHELRFWWHVTEGVLPEIIPNAAIGRTAARSKDVRLDDMRAVSMKGNNEWAANAADYILFEGSADKFEAAKKALKAMVEADVREASGYGIRIKRSKSGSLLFSQIEEIG